MSTSGTFPMFDPTALVEFMPTACRYVPPYRNVMHTVSLDILSGEMDESQIPTPVSREQCCFVRIQA